MFMQDATRFTATAVPALALSTPLRAGILAGTRVETDRGWRPIEQLARGDRLYSFDGGLRPVVAIDRDWLVPGSDHVVVLPGGAMGNSGDLALLPGQMILLDTWAEVSVTGAPVALAPAGALDGLFGARRTDIRRPVEVVIPVFAEEEGIYTDGGLLLHCPGVAAGPNGRSEDEFFTRLDPASARALLARRAHARAA
jgi:hypothetical protein